MHFYGTRTWSIYSLDFLVTIEKLKALLVLGNKRLTFEPHFKVKNNLFFKKHKN